MFILYCNLKTFLFNNLIVPAPESVILMSAPVTPIRPIGSNVTLICTMEFSPLVDVPLTVNTVWTGPAGYITTKTAQSVMGSTTTYTSTAMVSSFGREQSGNYTCTVSPFVMGMKEMSGTAYISTGNIMYCIHYPNKFIVYLTGVYFSLNGMIYGNNSVISISDIGKTDIVSEALQCITDKQPCCRSGGDTGEWFFPNGTMVPVMSGAKTFYRNRGNSDGRVNLNHLNSSIMSPTSLFCCKVPDATDEMQSLCTYIGKIIKRIGNDHVKFLS